jgi:hypothetical protein
MTARLDAQSWAVLRRFAFLSGFYLFWSALIGARNWAPVFAVMTFIAAIVEMSVALYRHEKIAASSLGRWDLAAAFIGLDCVVRAFA